MLFGFKEIQKTLSYFRSCHIYLSKKYPLLKSQNKKNEPFFIAVGFVRPHVPFVAPRQYFEPYPHEHMVLPPKVENDWDDIPPAGINYVTSLNGEMSEAQQKKAIAGYYASVSYMDAQLGKVLRALRDEGRRGAQGHGPGAHRHRLTSPGRRHVMAGVDRRHQRTGID